MTIVLFILATLFFGLLVLASSVQPYRSQYSGFELRRRESTGEKAAELDGRRERSYGDLLSIQRVIQAISLVGFVACVIGAFGWFIGMLVSVVVSLMYGKIAAGRLVHRWSQRLYDRYEMTMLTLVARYSGYVSWIRSLAPAGVAPKVASRQELRNVVAESSAVLTRDETALILASLEFDDKQVSDIMTPKSVVDTIKQTEILGPLVLDSLHKTGHNRFPVIDEDIDHVVGILYLRDILTLDGTKKHTAKVQSAMSKRVFYIRQDHTLQQALRAFLKTHHHMFIVINEFRETVGIITLEDTLEALLGKRIVDEFDAHDDMRAVAERNAVSADAPNSPTESTDI